MVLVVLLMNSHVLKHALRLALIVEFRKTTASREIFKHLYLLDAGEKLIFEGVSQLGDLDMIVFFLLFRLAVCSATF